MSKRLLCLMSLVLVSGIITTSRAADTIFFQELFEDDNFSARGWYDGTMLRSTTEHIPGSTSSAEFHFLQGASSPGYGGRMPIPESDRVYLSFYIKHSTSWIGSNLNWHPHQFHFTTNLNGAWVGPAYTFSTLYIETVGGEPRLALQDAENIDESNIGVDLTDITEERAIAGCNGNSDGTGNDDCYQSGATHRNGKSWAAGAVYFQHTPGAYYKNDWHFVEAYFQMNSIVDGIGIADGQLKYWYDGDLIIDYENIMLRTGEHPTMRYNQFLIKPYIGGTQANPGSPIDQTFWVDDLTVANYRVIPDIYCDVEDVNFFDYAVFASHWRDDTCMGPDWCECTDIDKSGTVDFDDLGQFGQYWQQAQGLFYESGGSVAFEAEGYTSKADGSGAAAGASWVEFTGNGSSGDGYVQALPDNGLAIDANIEAESPHLSYDIEFTTPGTYYLWLRCWSDDFFSQFVHYGLDGSATSSDILDAAVLGHDDAFTWRSFILSGSGRPTLTVNSAGRHTLDLWMREDGAKIDRVLLTTNAGYVPSD